MDNLQQNNKQINNYKKGLIIICLFLIIEAAVFLPIFYKKIQYNNLEMINIQSIEYVDYERELFSSVVLTHRYTEDMQIINNFSIAFNDGKIKPYNNQKDTNSVLIIKTQQSKTIYVYIQQNIAGFDYGKIKMQIENLEDLIAQIPQNNLVITQN